MDYLGLLGSLGSTLLGGAFNVMNNNSMMNDKISLMQLQQQYARQNAQDQRNWASQEAATQRAYNSREAQLAREWNSLPEQMQRARQAGVNPLAALSGANGQGAIAANSSVPQGAAAVAPGDFQVPNGMVNLQALGSFIQSISNAAKSAKETSRYDEVTDASLDQVRSLVAKMSSETFANDLQNALTMAFGASGKVAEINKLHADAFKAASEGNKAKADELLSKASEEFTKTKNEQAKLLWPTIEQKAKEEVNLIVEQQKTEGTRQEANRASAEESRTGAALNREKERTQKNLTSLEGFNAEIKRIESEVAAETKAKSVEVLLDELEARASKAHNEKVLQDIDKYRNEYTDLRNQGRLWQAIDVTLDYIKKSFPKLISIKD